jgi:ribosome-associated protein
MIEINRQLIIPEDEVRFTFSRSGGPGGQNVNKVNTKVTLWFDVLGSPSLSEDQKQKIQHRLGNRITKDGILQIVSAQFRTQKANREDAERRFAHLLANALQDRPRRKKTRIPKRVNEARLQTKKRRSMLKASRSGKVRSD